MLIIQITDFSKILKNYPQNPIQKQDQSHIQAGIELFAKELKQKKITHILVRDREMQHSLLAKLINNLLLKHFPSNLKRPKLILSNTAILKHLEPSIRYSVVGMHSSFLHHNKKTYHCQGSQIQTISCHNQREILTSIAQKIRISIISPVFTTPKYNAKPLSSLGFRVLINKFLSSNPRQQYIALGGVNASNFQAIKQISSPKSIIGYAGIRL